MRITVKENSPDRLVVRLVPTAAPVLIGAGLLMILAGPLVVWLMGYTTDLIVHSDQLQFKRAFLGRLDVDGQSIPLADIRAIETQVYSSMISRTLDVTVHTGSESVRIPFDNLDGDGKRELVSRLNAALDSGDGFSGTSGFGTPTAGFLLGGTLCIGGLCCLFFLQTSTIVGSKEQDFFGVKISRWLIPYNRESSVALSAFQSVEHKAVSVGTHTTATASSNRVFVQTRTGESLPLAAGPMFTDQSTAAIKKIVGTWARQANRVGR